MNNVNITPIQTEYKGCKFRSRLEARWAVFFDAMNVRWIYEPEGFRLPDGTMYLPDFYLPDHDIWVEVKGVANTKDENKIFEFYRNGGLANNNIVMVGDIPEETNDLVSFIYNRYPKFDYFINGFMDFPYVPCVCPKCGKFGFQFDGRGARICRHDDCDKGYTADDPRIFRAYKIARQARFEHGESAITESIANNNSNSQSIKNVLDDIKSDINKKRANFTDTQYIMLTQIIDKYYSKGLEK